MPEGENLSVECQSASQTLPERRKQRENDRKHVVGNFSGKFAQILLAQSVQSFR
jgi:hypothetical protein